MVKDEITPELTSWIEAQQLFFVGSAPLSGDGHVNLSPKAPIASFKVLSPTQVAYLDFTGSGSETIAHLREPGNGRIVIMFCAFQGPPRILRLHGKGRFYLASDPEFDSLFQRCGFVVGAPGDSAAPITDLTHKTTRSIIVVDVSRVRSSCGYDVPLMTPQPGRRRERDNWAKKTLSKGMEALVEFQKEENTRSVDGLPALFDSPPCIESEAAQASSDKTHFPLLRYAAHSIPAILVACASVFFLVSTRAII